MSIIDSIDTIAKDQKVRAFDIYALGPLLLFAATRKKPLGKWTRRSIFVAGIMTIVYNWSKYREAEKAIQDAI